MSRIDLIIDALDRVINACKLYNRQDIQDGGTVYLEEELEASIKALAAARELKALQPVGVFEYDAENQVWEELTPNCEGVKLYALDEVTK